MSLFYNKTVKDHEEHLHKAPPSNFTQQVSNPFKAATPQQHKFLSLTPIHVFVTKDLSEFPPKKRFLLFQRDIISQAVILWFTTRLKYKLNKNNAKWVYIGTHYICFYICIYRYVCVHSLMTARGSKSHSPKASTLPTSMVNLSIATIPCA